MKVGPTEGEKVMRPTAASRGDEPSSLAPGSIFGRYEIVRCIGEGGMGRVYEATHTMLRKRVALKALHTRLTAHSDFRLRFLREGETLARIRHPNVVDISDVGTHDDVTYLVMEFLEGESLFALLTREGRLDERRIANLMLPIIDGLAAAHAAGVVHRDLKPENIYLARDGKGELLPKLLDFGISKVDDAPQSMALTAGGGVLGTPFYMSPEQTRGSSNIDWRSDEYALGVVLYECATGRLPFHHKVLLDQMNAIVAGVYEHPCEVRPELSHEFAEIIIRAMALEPERRYAPLEALGRALLPFASSRARAYYEGVFAEDGPTAESVRPPPPVPSVASGAVTLPAGLPMPSQATPITAATDLPAPSRWRARAAAIALGLVLLLGLGAAALRVSHGDANPPAPSASLAAHATAEPAPPPATSPPAVAPATTAPAAITPATTVMPPTTLGAPPVPATATETATRAPRRRGHGASATRPAGGATEPAGAGAELDIHLAR
jgi:serine/threonine-protein kinase